VKSEYNPIIEETYLLNRRGSHVVVAGYSYGYIVCFSLSGEYVHNWSSAFFKESKEFRRIGKISRPRWDIYEKKWVLKFEQVEK